jgi:hypothetical protein
MQRLKTGGVALLTACALGGLAAEAASANSTVLPEFSTTSTAIWTIGRTVSNVEGTNVSCEAGAAAISPTSKKLGTFRILFSGCKASGASCWSLGQSAGSLTEEVTGEYHLVSLGSSRTNYLLWFLLSASDNTAALHLECESAAIGLVLIWGNVLGLVAIVSERTIKIIIETEGGGKTIKQKSSNFGNNSGTEVTVEGLKGKLGTGTERKTGISWEEVLMGFTELTSILES